MKYLTKLSTVLAVLLTVGTMAFAQTKVNVHGVVKDAAGEPIVGASVVLPGTTTGTISGIDGDFSLRNVPKDATLAVECLGYASQTIQLGGRTELSIVLEEDTMFIEETVVVGYGQMKKSDLTGSVSSVKTEILTDTPSNSIDGLLQGRVAGVQVINSSQDPGASSTIRIRGNSSLNGSNAPLVVIDGFPYGEAGAFNSINPQDIISMEVLKDASASAIYGSRGANGVILITTRKAKGNLTRVSVRQQTTISSFSKDLDIWRDPVLMAMISNEGRKNAGLTEQYIGAVNTNGIYYPSINELQTSWTTNTRWDELVFRACPVSDNTTIQIQSSNDRTMFTASANYFLDNGMYIKDNYNKFGGNFAVEHKIIDNLTLKASANITHSKRHDNGYLSYNRNPIFPVYNEDGSYWQYSVQDYYHPLALTELQKNETKGMNLISYFAANYQVLPCLNLTAQLNYKHGETVQDVYYPKKYSERGVFNDGYGGIQNWKDDNVVIEAYATFDKTFAQKHHVTAMAGYSYENYNSRSSGLAGVGFVNESLGNENLAAGDPEKYQISNSAYKTELVSGMLRLNYSYDNRYLVTFTARADGSSKFGANNKWAFFPSGAVSWKMNEESWMKDIRWIDLMKVRASYGISGNQGISAYQTLSRYGQHKYFNDGQWVTAIGPGYQSGYTGQGGIYAVWSGIPNTGLKWETTSQVDLGIDAGFFDNRLNVTFDWYWKHTSDLLRQRNIAPSSGYDKMWVNDGEILNRGFEVTIDGVFFRNRDWNVGGTFVFSWNRNKVVSLGNAVEAGLNVDKRTGMQYEFYGNSLEQYRAYTNILAVGQPMYVFYGYVVDGIVQSLADGLDAGLSGDDAQPGEYRYVNIYNADRLDTVNEDDRCIIGDPNPDFTASLALNASWKGLDFSIFFNGVFGNDVINTKRFGMPSNQPLRWTLDNRTEAYPRLNDSRQVKLSNWWVEDGSFVRIQTATLGYTWHYTKKDYGRKLRVYVSGDNLFTFTRFSGYDPEVSAMGIYSGGYPRLRKFTFGVDFTF
ncbi:MAG: TonB-dependent receptor [Bacteroidales bacterium]|nr:TonB-dependent receptor [Bacteroidales bacterium]